MTDERRHEQRPRDDMQDNRRGSDELGSRQRPGVDDDRDGGRDKYGYGHSGSSRPGSGQRYGYGRAGSDWLGADHRERESAYGTDIERERSRSRQGSESQGRGLRGFMERASDEVSSWFGDRDGEREPGRYRGRGPKNYTRSDERIREDVCDRLTEDSRIDAYDIDVQVSGSEVTLAGTVHSREERRRAEDCAEGVTGVRHVQNNLRVQSGVGPMGSPGTAQAPRSELGPEPAASSAPVDPPQMPRT